MISCEGSCGDSAARSLDPNGEGASSLVDKAEVLDC